MLEYWVFGVASNVAAIPNSHYSITPTLHHSLRGGIDMHTAAKISRLKLVCYTLAVLSLFGVAATSPASAQPVRIAVGAASVASLPTWVAHDGGYFAREGVPAELIYIRGGPQTMSALISGEVPFAQIYGGALVAAGLTGADVVIVAGLINQPFFSIITKGIDKPEDLRGKK